MIYEIRTYTVKPGKVAEWESRFGEAYEIRSKYSKLGGMWHTELGPLNQVVHMWAYENYQQRTEARTAARMLTARACTKSHGSASSRIVQPKDRTLITFTRMNARSHPMGRERSPATAPMSPVSRSVRPQD